MLVYIKTSYNVPIRNKTIPQSKIEKLSMKQKFKRYFLMTLVGEIEKFYFVFKDL